MLFEITFIEFREKYISIFQETPNSYNIKVYLVNPFPK